MGNVADANRGESKSKNAIMRMRKRAYEEFQERKLALEEREAKEKADRNLQEMQTAAKKAA